ncbi:MAG: HNH endonuclease [Dehalococcoidia bacterium]|nr:HNH endonuclease [Dehalococcoidia bacterium]
MKFWVGVTDNQWFKYHWETRPDEVNFWQPTPKPPFTAAPRGLPFLFKLRSPYNHIVGGGFYVTYSHLPLKLAWDTFGDKNGCATFAEFRDLINALRPGTRMDDEIGCTVLANLFYLDENAWIENPPAFAPNIMRGKMYDTNDAAGGAIWSRVVHWISLSPSPSVPPENGIKVAEQREKYGEPIPYRPRIGQSSFRVLVTDAYQRRCAITGERTLVTLEAAHIKPYADEGTHEVSNGLLLRADFHRLFDVGLVGVTPDLHVRVSRRIREEWFNGGAYYRLDGKPLSVVPLQNTEKPNPDLLDWHLRNRFQG